MSRGHFVEVPDEEVKAGDVVDVLGLARTVTAIRPYSGPLQDIVIALADTAPGAGFSLCRGQTTRVLRRNTLSWPREEVCS